MEFSSTDLHQYELALTHIENTPNQFTEQEVSEAKTKVGVGLFFTGQYSRCTGLLEGALKARSGRKSDASVVPIHVLLGRVVPSLTQCFTLLHFVYVTLLYFLQFTSIHFTLLLFFFPDFTLHYFTLRHYIV